MRRMYVPRSIEFGFFAALLDESIQLLSARGTQISDVWLDTVGMAFGVAVAILYHITQARVTTTKHSNKGE